MEPEILQSQITIKQTMFTTNGGYQLPHVGLWMALFSKAVAKSNTGHRVSRYNNSVEKDRIVLRTDEGLVLAVLLPDSSKTLWTVHTLVEEHLRLTEEMYAEVSLQLNI